MIKVTLGIFAHVDAGKTTFSEQLLFQTQAIRTLGRVDHKNTFMDTNSIERARGITIFSEQAFFQQGDIRYYLIDTPGHVDFSAEMARTIDVIDAAIVVVSGIDGFQSHTETILELLSAAGVPVLFFINKLDAPHADFIAVMQEIEAAVPECVNFMDSDQKAYIEALAERDEALLELYLASSHLKPKDLLETKEFGAMLARAVQQRRIMPVFKGSALKGEGIDVFLASLSQLMAGFELPGQGQAQEPLSAMVYKVRYDQQGRRLTFLKILTGQLKVRDYLGDERVTEIRYHQGTKAIPIEGAGPGDVVSVIGIKQLRIGDCIGTWQHEGIGKGPSEGMSGLRTQRFSDKLAPALRSRMVFAPTIDVPGLFQAVRQLEDEDPMLMLTTDLESRQITVGILGAVQLEVLKALMEERFGYQVDFEAPQVIYQETLMTPWVYGCGHFEPLRHYAEVHLTLEPLPLGSGVVFVDACHPEDLAVQYITQVRRCVTEMVHRGLLTGSALTDVRVTLITGRGHLQHTATGDFAQATLRAMRHGQEQAQMQLLEPLYQVRIRVPNSFVGRVMTDLTSLYGQEVMAETKGEHALITGRVPVATFGDYAITLASLTGGQGRLRLQTGGYAPCHNQEAVVAASEYDKDRDVAFPSGSVFCSKGKGYTVPWQEALEHMHCPIGEKYIAKGR